tara:strand:+ start:791 stop:1081 length:291 start_codon:yes stop_codon:yes gene_type:complete
MDYLKWKLSDNGFSGTGPEKVIAESGGHAEASEYVDGEGYRIGYMTKTADLTGLETWDVKQVTESEALAFCQNIWAEAVIDENGFITSQPPPENEE